jgi:hypothetical protein
VVEHTLVASPTGILAVWIPQETANHNWELGVAQLEQVLPHPDQGQTDRSLHRVRVQGILAVALEAVVDTPAVSASVVVHIAVEVVRTDQVAVAAVAYQGTVAASPYPWKATANHSSVHTAAAAEEGIAGIVVRQPSGSCQQLRSRKSMVERLLEAFPFQEHCHIASHLRLEQVPATQKDQMGCHPHSLQVQVQ